MSQKKCQFFLLFNIYRLHWHQWSNVMAFSCSSLNSLLKNVQHFYKRIHLSRDMMQTVKTIQNQKKHFNEYFQIQVIMGFVKPGIFWWILKCTGTCQIIPDHIRINPSGDAINLHNPWGPIVYNNFKYSNLF